MIKIKFRLVKKVFIALLSFSANVANSLTLQHVYF